MILFGATGFTGRLTAAALGQRDVPLVLAGRSAPRLAAVRDELEVVADLAVADATDAASVAALLEPDDVLVTTVGPFARLGRPAAQAAVSAGATYLDSTGEHAFLRWLVQTQDEPARACGARLLPAFGYDYVPGHLAAALALEHAGAGTDEPATGVRVGYFGIGTQTSGGTRASALGMLAEPAYRFRDGQVEDEPVARRTHSFAVAGHTRTGLSVGGTEPLLLPRSYDLDSVEVYLGAVVGRLAPVASLIGPALAALGRVPGVTRGVGRLSARLGSTGGPDAAARARARSQVVAEAMGSSGQVLGRALVVGPDPYDLTAGLLAEGAGRLLGVPSAGGGVLGPVEVFGSEGLRELAAAVGLVEDLTATARGAV